MNPLKDSTVKKNKVPLYPGIVVQLIGQDGNAIHIISKITLALRMNKVSNIEITKFINEAMSGDYGKVLKTCKKWVTIK